MTDPRGVQGGQSDSNGRGDANVAHARFLEGEDHVRLRLRLGGDLRSFYRPADEKLDKIRHRLQLLAAGAAGVAAENKYSGRGFASKRKKGKTKKKEKNGSSEQQMSETQPQGDDVKRDAAWRDFAVRFMDEDGAEVNGRGTTIGDALVRTTRIAIGDEELVVVLNQPLVTQLSVVEPLLAGIPVIPIAQTECCHPDDCSWQWFRLESDAIDEFRGGELCCSSRRFTPSSADVGCRFRIECRAPAASSAYAQDSKTSLITTSVVRGPERSGDSFNKRREVGATRATALHARDDVFRVMSYNVLFDGYTTSVHAQRNLFPYANPAIMREMYRAQLVFQEIDECNADVVCLQEVGQQIFSMFFEPMVKAIGFHAFYSGKTGTTLEGCATFVRLGAFRVVKEYTLDIAGATKTSPDPSVRALLLEFSEIAKGVGRAPSIAQILELEPVADACTRKRVLVSNTHLFYREDSHLIRLAQTVALVRELRDRHEEAERVGLDPAVVMCGDFNSFPGTIPVAFLLNGVVDSSHPHWQSAPSFRWARTPSKGDGSGPEGGCPNENARVLAGRIEHPFHLVSGCGIPEFTNFAGTFVGTLDYIFVDNNRLQVCSVFPFFTAAEAAEEVALPSSKLPSDHVAIVCDLAWRQ